MKYLRILIITMLLLCLTSCQKIVNTHDNVSTENNRGSSGRSSENIDSEEIINTQEDDMMQETAPQTSFKPLFQSGQGVGIIGDGSFYVVESDKGCELWYSSIGQPLGIYSEYRILNHFDLKGNIEQVYFFVDDYYSYYGKEDPEGNTKVLLKLKNGKLYPEKKIKEHITFYGDYIVIDGRLYNSGLRFMGNASGEPLEKEPSFTDTITFEDSSLKAFFMKVDYRILSDNPKFIKELREDSVSVIDNFNFNYTTLNQNDSGNLFARIYHADIGGGFSQGFYISEETVPVELFYYNDKINIYRCPRTDSYWITNSQNEVLYELFGSIELTEDHIIYQPCDIRLPKTFFTKDGRIFLQNVVKWCETDMGTLIYYAKQFEQLFDSEGREDGFFSDHFLGLIDKDQKIIEYGEYDKVFDITALGALVIKDNVLKIVSINGEEAYKLSVFDGDPEYLRHFETTLSNDGKSVSFLLKRSDLPSINNESPDILLTYSISK